MSAQYNKRITIIPDAVNSIIIARMLAFCGEICWGIQIGWAMRTIARNLPMRGSQITVKRVRTAVIFISYWLSLFAIVGNICSVASMITANFSLAAAEESLWACLFFFGGVSAITLWHFGVDSWSFDWGSNCFGYDINPFDEYVSLSIAST
jgi:hypothetical protein